MDSTQVTTMTQVKIQNGSVVEDTYKSQTEESDVTEVYTWLRILKNHQGNLRYKIRDDLRAKDDYSDDFTLPEDSDVVQYHEYLKNISVEGMKLGAIQAAATDFTGDEYFANHSLGDAIDVRPANDIEQQFANRLHSELNDRDKRVTKHFDEAMVPLTPDKEEMPMFVVSNDRNGGLQNFEEATDMMDEFIGHLDVEVDAEPEETSDESSDENSDADGDEEDFFLSDVDKVGPATSDNLKEYLVENRVTVDWRNHIDAEAWSDAPVIVSKGDAQERLQSVAGDMPSGAFQMASDKIGNGDIDEAIVLIEDYE